jgi:hypothetical protein
VSLEFRLLRVAVIGAGASGLASAVEFKQRGHEVVVFEQDNRPGGIWAYCAEVEDDLLGEQVSQRVYSSLYHNLRTNLPSDIMAFKGFPFDESGGGHSSWPRFPHHSCVYEYLVRYIEHHELAPIIQFSSRVERVEEINAGWRISINGADEIFDAVAICSGHFSEPRLPKIGGLETFRGTSSHSHNYRSAASFSGKRVAVLGCGASGADISQELRAVASEVYWCGFPETRHRGNLTMLPFPDRITGDGIGVEGKDYAVDHLLFCTGYRYDLPFLPNGIVTIEDNYISALYRDILPPSHPTLGMIGLPFLVVPFPLYAMQAKWFASHLDRDFQMPDKSHMLEASATRERELRQAGVKQRHMHRLGPAQENYYNTLASDCGAEPLPEWFGELASEAQRTRQANPSTFRDVPLSIPRQVHL